MGRKSIRNYRIVPRLVHGSAPQGMICGLFAPLGLVGMYSLNYRHLYYFWVVAKEGGFARASERLDMAIQTISTQVRELEKSLGYQLLKPQGRGVTLTPEGETTLKVAEEIFQIGQRLPIMLKELSQQQTIRLAVGLQDSISKLAAHSLLTPVLDNQHVKLLCHEGEFDELLAELALHHLDVVFAGQGAPNNPNLRLYSQLLSSSPLVWYAPTALLDAIGEWAFPQILGQIPLLLPTEHTPVRPAIDRWFEELGLYPRIAGEFEDSALLSLFAAKGLGAFPVSESGQDDIALMNGLQKLGVCEIRDEVHAVYTRRGKNHPVVQKLLGPSGNADAD